MLHTIVPATAALGASWLSFGDAKRDVASVVGGQDDPAVRAQAGRRLLDVIADWNRQHAFDYGGVADVELAITANDPLVQLPYDWRECVTVRVQDAARPLMRADLHMWQRYVSNAGDWPVRAYTTFTTGLTGYLRLLGTPSEAGTLELNYISALREPVEDLDPLPGPIWWQRALVLKAKGLMLAHHQAESRRATIFLTLGREAFREARADDQHDGDEVDDLAGDRPPLLDPEGVY